MKTKIVAVAKNEEKYLEEWLKYHFSLGFDNITIYDNGGNGELKSNDKLTVYDAPGDRIQLQAYQNELVNAQWLKMGEANTPEEIQAVLDTWPRREDFYKDEESEDE